MTTKLETLKNLLRELFQLDRPDLDFGLYRIMHAKSAEVTQFLDQDLLPQVKTAFESYTTADKAELERQLAEAIEQAKGLGVDPDATQKVKELRAKLKSEAVDLDALESEVYDHLYSFFRRYYSEGDFLSKRVYKPGVYAIPYEGEEVKLHWANADQYYIKTSEYLRDYAFRLKPHDDAKPMRVHFKLVDAAEGEHGNVKEAHGKERRFKLATNEPLAIENGDLTVRFTYLPDAAKAKELNAAAESAILACSEPQFAEWVALLGKLDPTEKDPARTVLGKHLGNYTARNTFDYFIHKDLGGFLRRELDFYIKNEVMHLDDVENATAPRVEQYLSKIKVIRRIAGKLIDFLAQLEDFQKKLWLKKKFVVETSYLIRVGCIPESFYAEIAANEAQREEWKNLCVVHDSETGRSQLELRPATGASVLSDNQALMIDTSHFERNFVNRLLEHLPELHAELDAILVRGDNMHSLQIMSRCFETRISCIYIDPPYNAQSSEILYKNDYRHSSWLTLMANRLSAATALLAESGTLVCAIDEVEQELLGQLLTTVFPQRVKECLVVNHNPSGQQGDNFSYTHEYAYFVHAGGGRRIAEQTRENEPDWDERNFRDVTGEESLRDAARNCFYPIFVRGGQVVGFGDVCPPTEHPAMNERIDANTIAVYPIDPHGIERKWRFARHTVESIKNELRPHELARRGVIDIKRLKKTFNYKTNWVDARYSANNHGTQLLNHLLPSAAASYPKSIFTVRDSVHAALNGSVSGWVVDFFAGSGTTGHAVVTLNREDSGRRKFILVEDGDHFDTVLVPRLKKVTFTPDWKDGKPKRLATAEEIERGPRIMKVIRLESYEDALNNLDLKRTKAQADLLTSPAAQGGDGFKEQYVLRYMLDVESRGSASLLNVNAFADPTAYTLKVKRPGTDESRVVPVDLLETFNWLLGLTVQHIAAPMTFGAAFVKSSEGRLRVKDALKADAAGPWWFRTVTGTLPDGRKVLVIWRKLTGKPEEDNLVLDTWFSTSQYSTKDREFALIYVNGDNNLENLKNADDTWKVRLIEEDFQRLMFDTEDV